MASSIDYVETDITCSACNSVNNVTVTIEQDTKTDETYRCINNAKCTTCGEPLDLDPDTEF